MLCRSRIITFFSILLFVTATTSAQPIRPKNIIVMIGDGMGFGQLSALVLGNPASAVMEFPVTGFSATQSSSNFVTESPAGGTALSTGYRTNNVAIGQLPDGRPVQTLFEYAREFGKAVGVIVTSSVTDATPAAFLAHVPTRKLQFDIAEQIASSEADIIFGAGRKWFLPQGKGGQRADGRNLSQEMEERGYTVSIDTQAPHVEGKKMLWLTANAAAASATKRKPTSAEMLEVAFRYLSQKENGFVLMLEGSQIDWASHDNDFKRTRDELNDFDAAIRLALEFAKNDGNTLVVVTADHETGGLGVLGNKPDGSDMYGKWLTKGHTGALVPVLAFGPMAERFSGIQRNMDVGRKLFHCLGDKEFEEIP